MTKSTWYFEDDQTFATKPVPIKCNSLVSVAAFGTGDPGLNPGWFAVSNSHQKLSFHE